MKKVICINPPSFRECVKHHVKPLVFLQTYTVLREIEQQKGLGYVLEEVDNSHIVVVDSNGNEIPGAEFTYHSNRFIPLSESEVRVKETELQAV